MAYSDPGGGSGMSLTGNQPFNWMLYGQGSADGVGANLDKQAGNMSSLSGQIQKQSADQWNKYEQLYQPVEAQYVNDAQNIDSQENQDRVAADASSQVKNSYQQAAEAKARELSSLGVNPNSGRSLDTQNQLDMSQAAADAQAQTNARQTVKDRGISMRAGVVGQGNTVANNSMLGDQTALGGYSGSGNLTIGGTNANTSAFNANTTNNAGRASQAQNTVNSILGSISGMGGMGSSKKFKTDKKPISDAETLDKLKKVPVASWKYKDGMFDGGNHIGAYAEDVNKQFGDEAAPGGKMLDTISMHGIEMSAIRGLAKQVDKLNSRMAILRSKGA